MPHGHPGDNALLTCVNGLLACDEAFEVPPVGRFGRAAAGLEPLEPFLGGGEEEEGE